LTEVIERALCKPQKLGASSVDPLDQGVRLCLLIRATTSGAEGEAIRHWFFGLSRRTHSWSTYPNEYFDCWMYSKINHSIMVLLQIRSLQLPNREFNQHKSTTGFVQPQIQIFWMLF
jgi:hypothetical protein